MWYTSTKAVSSTRSRPFSPLVVTLVLGCACTNAPAVPLPRPPPARLAPLPLPPPVPSFRTDVLPVLVEHCARAEGCHGEAPTDSVALDLRPAAAYAELVGHLAKARPSAMRVAPGIPDASFLLDKLAGTLGPHEGKRMPIDADTGVPLDPSPLPADYIELRLRPWIAAGAPEN